MHDNNNLSILLAAAIMLINVQNCNLYAS